MEESTFLSRSFADQGLKIRIRKELRQRRKLSKVSDTEENSSVNENDTPSTKKTLPVGVKRARVIQHSEPSSSYVAYTPKQSSWTPPIIEHGRYYTQGAGSSSSSTALPTGRSFIHIHCVLRLFNQARIRSPSLLHEY